MFFPEVKKRYLLRADTQVTPSPGLRESYEKGIGADIHGLSWLIFLYFATEALGVLRFS